MKKILLAAAVFMISANLFAQSNKEDVQMIQAMYGKDKKELVQEYMELAAADTAKFWKLYDEYEDNRKALGQERISILQEYADKYDKLDDKTATSLMQKYFAFNTKYIQLQEKYFAKFSESLGALKSAKFFQLESYLENAIRITIQDNIPFIGELDTLRK